MSSELWQRLREARKFANKRQLDLAKALGITRSAYAFWENPNPEERTSPNVDQIKVAAAVCGVPLNWLMSDSSAVSDLYREGAMAQYASQPAKGETPATTDAWLSRRFWGAVEYQVASADARLARSFERSVSAGPVELPVSFLSDRLAAHFSSATTEQQLIQDVGYMLLVGRAAGRPARGLLILVKGEDSTFKDIRPHVREHFGVEVAAVTEPEEAASLILSANS